jgi:xylose dehydrogenase (NAD/NADP)
MSIRWGFLGASWVAKTALVPAVKNATNATLQAVASRDPKRSAAFEPTTVHNSYDELLADPNVDAVYISLANHLHCEWVVKALNAGKHVLCEKPLATTSAQARLMAGAADANDRLLVEAVWTRWHPRFARMVEIVRGSELGDLRSIESDFTFPGNFVDNYRTNPEFGGGSLLDVGPYQVHTWVALRGIDSQFNVLELDRNIGPTGIDMTTQVTGQLSSAESARIEVRALASFERPEQQRLVVTGSLNQLECVGNEAFTSWNSASALRIGDRQEDFAPIDPFQVMLQDFGSRITGDEGWLPELSESIRVMEILDQIRLAPSGA